MGVEFCTWIAAFLADHQHVHFFGTFLEARVEIAVYEWIVAVK